jgi:hypothetical protein
MSRPNKRFQTLAWIEDKGVSYLFGQGGYIEATDYSATAYVLKDTYRLRTPDFAETYPGPQQLPVSWGGLKGMAEHLKVASSVAAQKRLVSYQKVFSVEVKHE